MDGHNGALFANRTTAWRELNLNNEEGPIIRTEIAEKCQYESIHLVSRCVGMSFIASPAYKQNLCARIGTQHFDLCTETTLVSIKDHLSKTRVDK